MRDFNYELKCLCQRNRDGSYATCADRAFWTTSPTSARKWGSGTCKQSA